MKKIGLHLRIDKTIVDCIQQAIDLGLPHFQCFFLQQATKKYIHLNQKHVNAFTQLRKDHFDNVFAHASYWVNLGSGKSNGGTYVLKREITAAKKLSFSHLILHPGAGIGCPKREDGIDNIAKRLNAVLKKENELTILLENTAFGKNTIGGSISDLAAIREKIDHPEKVQFCIDTAHAFSFGYDLTQKNPREKFIKELEEVLGIDTIKLIHLNDTHDACGSKRDKHAIVGEGLLGKKTLSKIIHDERLKHIPFLMELPPLEENAMKTILTDVNAW